MYVCVYVDMHACMHACIYESTYVHACVCVCACACGHVYTLALNERSVQAYAAIYQEKMDLGSGLCFQPELVLTRQGGSENTMPDSSGMEGRLRSLVSRYNGTPPLSSMVTDMEVEGHCI